MLPKRKTFDVFEHEIRCIQLYRSYLDTFRINLAEPGTITAGGVPTIPTPSAPLSPAAKGVTGAL